ncbi:hypothetical protein EU527_00915 [Candidatus Thorarchaeota archaeon]|nr:MAG: hypothetical protein EU527_00915 [Candidatus Thorarchaeota archaeon]
MASISIRMQTTFEKSSVIDIVTTICDNLDQNARSQVMPWIPQIEEYAIHLIDNLRPKDTRRRKREVMLAAAIYDTFLEFESRTRTKIRLPLLQKVLSLKMCSINSTWISLFDIGATLSMELMDSIRLTTGQTIDDAIPLIINQLSRAAQDKSEHITEWLRTIERDALELNNNLNKEVYSNYDPIIIAVTLVYAAAKFFHGKMAIKITQRDLANLSGFSSSHVSKCWIDLFGH